MVSENNEQPSEPKQPEMVDITSLVEQAAETLTFVDPMICIKESFSLQDSMAALELMDRKMDCCEVPASQVAPYGVEAPADVFVCPRPAPTGLDDEVDPLPWDDLTMKETASIAMEVLVRFEGLLGGASVVESTFTCLYAHHPVLTDMKKRLEQPAESLTEQIKAIMKSKRGGTIPQQVVYTLSIMLLELTDIVRSIVLNADIYEEEDFTVNTYNIAMFSDRDEEYALQLASEVIELVKTVEDQESAEVKTVLTILQFQVDFFKMCITLARLSGKAVRDETVKAGALAAIAFRGLETIESILPELTENETDRTKSIVKQTFSPLVNRPLVGNAPVRKIMFNSAPKSIVSMKKLTKDMQWALCDMILKGDSLSRVRRMLCHASTSSVNILIRSLIILNLYFDDKVFGQFSLPQMIIEHIQQLSDTSNHSLSHVTALAFLNRLAKPIYDTLKLQILNRNRQRAYMEAIMLPDWASLQQEAHIVDATYRKENGLDGSVPPYMSLYVLLTTIELMDHFVVLGIEQDLFCNHHELMVAYWYRDYLLSSLLNQMSSLRKLKHVSQEAAHKKALEVAKAQPKGRKKGGKQKKGKNNVNISPPAPTPYEIEDEYEFILVSMKRGLCRGAVRYFAALYKASFLQQQEYKFTTLEKLFAKRFEAFSPIQHPPQLHYNDFVQGSDFQRVSQNDLMTSATDCFSTSKSMIDKLITPAQTIDATFLPVKEEELRRLVKVCVANSVYLQRLRQIISANDDSKISISYDFETQRHFCVIKLK